MAYKGLTRYCWAEKAPTHFVMRFNPSVPGLGQLFDLGREVSTTHHNTLFHRQEAHHPSGLLTAPSHC